MAGNSAKILGKVEAIDSTDLPQTFVVKTNEAKGKELIVGCRLDQNTIIKRGRKKGKLEDFKSGERVSLTYERVEDGLVCQTIEKKIKSLK